jgi:predicted RNA binding protein YcfA (HicA-like mRNA interferase family)
MTRLPRVRAKNLIRALRKIGFEIVRSKGSHHFLAHKDGRGTVIPIHPGEIIGTGLLVKILKDVEVTREELLRLL